MDLFELSGSFEKSSIRILRVPAYYFLGNIFMAAVESYSRVGDVSLELMPVFTCFARVFSSPDLSQVESTLQTTMMTPNSSPNQAMLTPR